MAKCLSKYGRLIGQLDGGVLYNVAKIIRLGLDNGFFDAEEDARTAKKRAQSALANQAPKLDRADEEIEITESYFAFYPDWLGSTWKTLF